MKFQIFLTTQAQHMWRLLAANGLTIATSGESYVQKHDCLHGIGLVMGTTSVSQYTLYQDTAGEWRWRLVATNGQIIAVSSEAYHNYADCVHSAQLAVSTNTNTPVEDLTLRQAAGF